MEKEVARLQRTIVEKQRRWEEEAQYASRSSLRSAAGVSDGSSECLHNPRPSEHGGEGSSLSKRLKSYTLAQGLCFVSYLTYVHMEKFLNL